MSLWMTSLRWHQWLPPSGRQQQVVCFCPDSILVRSARNMCHVMPTTPPPSQSSPSFHLPARGRWGGGEGPPSLGSQPLNQALSHPVNLKQSGFNSSCLPVPALVVNVEAHSSEARRLRTVKAGQDASEESAQADTSNQVFLGFYFCFSSFLPYGSLRSVMAGEFLEFHFIWLHGWFWFSLCCSQDAQGRILIKRIARKWFVGTVFTVIIKEVSILQHRYPHTATAGPNYHPGQIFVLTGSICIRSNCTSVLHCFYLNPTS